MQTTSLKASLQRELSKDFQGSLEQIYLTLERNTCAQQLNKGKTFMWLSTLILTAVVALFQNLWIMPMTSIVFGAISGGLAAISLILCLFVLIKFENIRTLLNGVEYMKNCAEIKIYSQETDLKIRNEILDEYTYFIQCYLDEIITPRGVWLGYIVYSLMGAICSGIFSYVWMLLKGGCI